jgi:hypothetical protein
MMLDPEDHDYLIGSPTPAHSTARPTSPAVPPHAADLCE